jgi:hypothetical protein
MKNLLVITLLFSSFGFGDTDASYCMENYDDMDLVIRCMQLRGDSNAQIVEKEKEKEKNAQIVKKMLEDRKKRKEREKDDNLFLSCEVIDKGRTKLEYKEYAKFYKRIPDEEKFPIFLDIEKDKVSIEATGKLEGKRSNVKFSGSVEFASGPYIEIKAKLRSGENWYIDINRATGQIKIKPRGVVGILDAIERIDNNKPVRILEGYCEGRTEKYKF